MAPLAKGQRAIHAMGSDHHHLADGSEAAWTQQARTRRDLVRTSAVAAGAIMAAGYNRSNHVAAQGAEADATPTGGNPTPDEEGLMLPPGGGRRLVGPLDATLKVSINRPSFASTFELVIPPGSDVGAHVHTEGEEMFYVVEGQLDVLAFEPIDRSIQDWREWESKSGQRFMSGGPGAFMYVPIGTPHAFANRSDKPVKVFFQSSIPGGHEKYFEDLAALLTRTNGHPTQSDVEAIRRRYGIEQLTPMTAGK